MRGFQRPKSTVLPDAALVPAANLVQPAPTHFTHQVRAGQPFFYSAPKSKTPADGQFAPGTCVVLHDPTDGIWCHVVDGRGLCVFTAREGLVPLHTAKK
jgi:hypothetical protein